MKTYTLTVNEKQLQLIKDATEYLWRHLIWQPNFKCLLLEDRIDPKEKIDCWYILTDMRKVIMHEYNKGWSISNVHAEPVFRMWKEELIKLEEEKSNIPE